MRRAVFFDRDGVLTDTEVRDGKPRAPLTLGGFRIVKGAGKEVARLRDAGLLCIVITNQPEVARGTLDPAVLGEMHSLLRSVTGVDDIYLCAHEESENCPCYKPRPGMPQEAAKKWGIDLARSFVVGDRWRDVGTGKAVGAFSILVRRPYSNCDYADAEVSSLREAVNLVLSLLEQEQ